MPRKQKAAMTRRSSTVWGFMQKSVGGNQIFGTPCSTLEQKVPTWEEFVPLGQSWSARGVLENVVMTLAPTWPTDKVEQHPN